MSRVVQTRRALRDLDDIWFYLAQDNLGRADRFVDSIVVKCEAISESPYMAGESHVKVCSQENARRRPHRLART